MECCRAVRLHAITLLLSWTAATGLVLIAEARAPLAAPGLDLLRANAGWYAAGYGFFLIADGAVALLGVSVTAALALDGHFRRAAIVVLFALSGMLGGLADIRMVAAAQLLHTGSPLFTPANAETFLEELNAACNWLSVGSFLAAALGTLLAAHAAHASVGWTTFTKASAAFQLATAVLSAVSFFAPTPLLTGFVVAAAVIGTPLLAAAWLFWMLRIMNNRIDREGIA